MTENEAIEILNEVQTVDDSLNQYIYGYDESFNMAIEALKEIQKYRKIGTVDKCKEAIEKQIGRKPVLDNVDTWICPICNSADVTTQDEYGEDNGFLNYCGNCGQKLDWEGLNDNN